MKQVSKDDLLRAAMYMKAACNTNNEFCVWLYTQMGLREWRTITVADKLKTTKQTVCNHLKGEVMPSFITVIAYCWLFDEPDIEGVYTLISK